METNKLEYLEIIFLLWVMRLSLNRIGIMQLIVSADLAHKLSPDSQRFGNHGALEDFASSVVASTNAANGGNGVAAVVETCLFKKWSTQHAHF